MQVRILVLVLVVAAAVAGEAADPLPFPDMAPSVGVVLDKHYYDRSRFRPHLMVERALRRLEQSEIAIDTAWVDGRIMLNLRNGRQTIDAPEPDSLAAAMRVIETVRAAVEKSFDAPVARLRELAYFQLNGALSTLDPHTVLWPPEAAREWSEDNIQGQFYGIGAFLNQEEGLISIQRVMPGFPAERAGIADGDVILAIDGEKTAGLTLDQAVRRIKGPKGTTVALSVERKGLKAPIEVPIVRDLVKVVTIRQHRDGDVGYVRMDDFNANTAQDLFVALRELERDAPLKALVLDLRFNGGGLLDQAKLIGSFFLGRGQEVVRTVTVDGKQETFSNERGRRFVTCPMVVLTSPGTASASEIVAGALQLNERAVIAGQPTFGKGSVQNIRELRDGSRLKLTIQEYLLPGGLSIQDVGVMPDLLMVRHAVRQDGRIDLRDLSYEREHDQEFALGSRRNYERAPVAELSWLDPWIELEARRQHTISARVFLPDRQAQVAIDLLKAACAAPDWAEAAAKALVQESMPPFLIELLAAPAAARAESEAAALAAALARLPQPVVWGPPGVPPPGSLALTWTGSTTVRAGETVALSVQVANRGPAEVGRLYALVRSDQRSPFWEEEFVIGAVPAGGASTGILHFKVPPRLPDGQERFTIDLHQVGGRSVLTSCTVELAVAAKPAPHLGLAWRVVDSSADGRLAIDERAELVVEVFNQGEGPLDAGAVWIEKDNDPYVSLGVSRLRIEAPIPPGGATTLTFPLSVRPSVMRQGQPIPFTADRIKLDVVAVETMPDDEDARYRAVVRAGIEIPVGSPLKSRRLAQPRIAFAGLQEEGTRQRLRFSISDESDDPQRPALDIVALFHEEDKIELQPATALDGPAGGPWLYTPRIQLRPGLNQLRLTVRDADGVVADRFLRLWGPPDALPAP